MQSSDANILSDIFGNFFELNPLAIYYVIALIISIILILLIHGLGSFLKNKRLSIHWKYIILTIPLILSIYFYLGIKNAKGWDGLGLLVLSMISFLSFITTGVIQVIITIVENLRLKRKTTDI